MWEYLADENIIFVELYELVFVVYVKVVLIISYCVRYMF